MDFNFPDMIIKKGKKYYTAFPFIWKKFEGRDISFKSTVSDARGPVWEKGDR